MIILPFLLLIISSYLFLTEKTDIKNMMNIAISKIVFRPKESAKAPQKIFPKKAPNMHTEIRIPSFASVILPGVTSLPTTFGSSVKCRRPNSLVFDQEEE